MHILAVIPARSGSKGVPHKNISIFSGKPLLAHSIEQALKSKTITRAIVSTDSEMYAQIARQYGAETPFLRPAEIAADYSTDLEVFKHALKWLKENEGYLPDICVHLRPTYPGRTIEDIDRAVELLISDPSFDSVRSVVKATETPYKTWFLHQDGSLEPVLKSNLHEPYSQPRQLLPPAYVQNACVDVVTTRVILERNSMTGDRIRGMVMDHSYDIDNSFQFSTAMEAVQRNLRGYRIVFDIDGVIATITPDNNYEKAQPIQANIDLVNALYEAGNIIVLFTARGSSTNLDWIEVTKRQLQAWGVKYHELIFGKPAADMYVDDRFVTLDFLRNKVKSK